MNEFRVSSAKYSEEKVVGAIYDNGPADNPFLAAMPDLLSLSVFQDRIRSMPHLPHRLTEMTSEERRQSIPIVASVFFPAAYMYQIYDTMYRAIRTTYTSRAIIDSIKQTNMLFCGGQGASYATQADTGSILGVPGIGKTSTIHRCLSLMPQVIEHTKYQGQSFFCKQVLYLAVECPSDCSVKTLAFNVLGALDKAIKSNYLENLMSLRTASASAVAVQIKVLCLTHHVGMILVDEIQNAVETAHRNRQIKPLIKFLVELMNDTCTAVYFVGTPIAEELFSSEEHLKRRTRGLRLLPMKPDGTFRRFVEQLWQYQLTPKQAPLTDKMLNKLFDWSGGIPAYIIKIFQESQVQALLMGQAAIDEKTMQRAIDILAIKIPKTYSGGTYISDFELTDNIVLPSDTKEGALEEVPRMYANKRGRKAVRRDAADLLVAYRDGQNMMLHLATQGLIERLQPC